MDIGLDLSDQEFWSLSRLVYQKAGINLHKGKKELVRTRLAKRIREGGFESFRNYYDYVLGDQSGEELTQLLDAVSTNLTSFFREPRHFEFMAERFLPELTAKSKSGARRLRIWSAGCSTGEEAYSIAVTVLEHLPRPKDWEVKVLATDLSERVLGIAGRGVYPARVVENVPRELLRRYFQVGQGDCEGWYRVKDEVRRLVVFRRLNLMESFPFRRPFQLIFCRNVMIYFDRETQKDLVTKFYRVLDKGGYLFIGHAESLSGLDRSFQYLRPTIYRK